MIVASRLQRVQKASASFLLGHFVSTDDITKLCRRKQTFLLAASPLGDVSRAGTASTQRQKFHTDDVKSVQNPVIRR